MNYREILPNDSKELIFVRTQTDQNNYSIEELLSLGINEESIKQKLASTYKGWLCEDNTKIVGFSIGNKSDGEMWVIAVLPEYINKGIGSHLLNLVVEWLWDSGCKESWLTTDIDTKLRAYSFYKKHGWYDYKIDDGLRYMKINNPRYS